jgi:hypothetical protein
LRNKESCQKEDTLGMVVHACNPSEREAKTGGSCQAPMAHICNPSNSGGRDREDQGSKPARANSSARPYLKKIGLVEWLKVTP